MPAGTAHLARPPSRTLLTVYAVADLIGVFISNIKKGQHGSFPPWASIPPAAAKLRGQARVLFDLLASPEYAHPEPLAIFNGDVGLQPAAKINVLYSTLLAALNILKFSRVADDPSSAPRFQQHPEQKRAPYYLGYHADDWFRAVFAIYYFNERRRKVIDVPGGNFATPPLSVFKVTTTDSERMVDKSLVTLSEEAELLNIATQLKKIRAQMPTLPASVDDSRLQTLLRRGDTKYQYMVSLKMGTSLTRARKDLILKKKAVARDLDERYVEMLPLSIDAAADILTLLRARFPKGRVHIVPQDVENAFYASLGERTRSYLFNQEGLAPAFAEIEGRTASVQEAYGEVVKLLNRAAVTSDLIDTLEPPPISWPRALELLGTSEEELTSQEGFS